MSLDEGNKIPQSEFMSKIYPDNLKRLRTWCSVGLDVDNGIWAIYGTRLGFYMTNLTDWDYIEVRDFKKLDKIWENVNKDFDGTDFTCPRTNYSWDYEKVKTEILRLGEIIEKEYNLQIPLIGIEESKFLKSVFDFTTK